MRIACIKQIVLSVVFLLVLYSTSLAQTTFPVQINTHLLPPYSLYLSDYYSGTREKITVTLINRDQLKPMLTVRLRMIINATGGVRLQTNDNAQFPPIIVENGLPVRLSAEELAPYFQPSNFITQGVLPGGKLPEGMVEICFQAVEAYTGQVLSASTCTRAWITSQKPPLLSLPLNNESVAFRDPLNLMFQWTPRHQGISTVEYEFVLKELWDNGMTPQAAFPYSPEIYRETVRSTSLIYGPLNPPLMPGKRYAWCIRAQARDGIDPVNLFQNEGYSEVRWFTLQDNCFSIEQIAATGERKRLSLAWEGLPEHVGFTVSYRPKDDNNQNAVWKEQQTFDPQLILYGLANGATYEYRVGSTCMTSGQPVYSPTFVITLPESDSARIAQCGIMPQINISNREPIKELKTGDVFMANDYPVTITQISGASGRYKGEGYAIVPWFNDAKIAVAFENILINTDKQMIEGYVDAKYDKNESQIANLDELSEGGYDVGTVKTGITHIDHKVDFTIPGVESFSLNEEGNLVITDEDGAGHVVAVPNQEGQGNLGNQVEVFPMTVSDKDGNVYQVEKVPDGGTDAAGKPTMVAKATFIGKTGDPLAAGSYSPQNIDEDKAIVTFEKGAGVYGFDTWQEYYNGISLIRDKYEKIGSNYYVPWKFLPDGRSDQLKATIQIKDPSIKAKNVIFKTALGTSFQSEYDSINKVYTLQITAGPAGDVQELYALHPRSADTYYTLGKISIATYEQQQYKVVLVAVNNAEIKEQEIQNALRLTYGPVAVTWQVEIDRTFTYAASNEFMQNSTGIRTYNDAMRGLNSAYEQHLANTGSPLNKESNYLFFLNATNNELSNFDYSGFMPRGAQFGYIFTNSSISQRVARTVAHELGHGRWQLFHPFDDHYGGKSEARSTQNIMSYSTTGYHLAKWQWDIMNDPALLVNVFEGDEKSEYSDSEYFTKLLQQIRCAYISGSNSISMPERYKAGGDREEVGIEYGRPVQASEINGLKVSRGWWSAPPNTTEIGNIQNPLIDSHRGEIKFQGLTISVPVPVYQINSGVTPFEHFRSYMFPTETAVRNEFNSVWQSGIRHKIENGEPLNDDDVKKLKAIASCETKYLDVDSRYKLVQAIMNFSTREYFEDLILDVFNTTPAGDQSRQLFEKINTNRAMLISLLETMDNYGGEERNFDRLAKEYYNLFTKAYNEVQLLEKYPSINEDRKLFFYGFGNGLCEWSIEVSREDHKLNFEEKLVWNYEPGNYTPYQEGSSAPTCEQDDDEYTIDIDKIVSIRFIGANFLVDRDKTVVLPASVYYILIKSHSNEIYYQTANAAWFLIGIATPVDEFYLLAKALQYGKRSIQAIRLAKVKSLAKVDKIEIPLNQNGLKLKEEAVGKIEDFVKWENPIPPVLLSRLTQQGIDKLKTWTGSKSLSFLDEAGNVFTGLTAELKIFEKLENLLISQRVLGTFEDSYGRLLIQCEGERKNIVYGLLTDKNGKQVIYKFDPAYKPSANPEINVPLSVNKLAPDFKETEYLYPVIGDKKNIVRIKMSGKRNSTSTVQGDYELANIQANFPGKTPPKFTDANGVEIPYTWHHLDDYNPVTGECTMQLVRGEVHTKVEGMTHSGSVAQYKAFNGSGY